MRAKAQALKTASAAPSPPGTAPAGRIAPEPSNPLWQQLATTPLRLQAKLTVGAQNDPYEKEADQIADQVMRMPAPVVQRKCAACEEEEKEGTVQAKETPGEVPALEPVALQRKCACAGSEPCEKCKQDLPMQHRKAPAAPPGAAVVPPSVHRTLTEAGQPMDASIRSTMESRFGRHLGAVRVHTGPSAAESARGVHALAFTVGQHIVFGQGRYAPGTSSGHNLLAHELAHTLQQRDGRLSEGTHKLEAEADRFAAGTETQWKRPARSPVTELSELPLLRSPAQCSSVTINLPGSIVFEGDEGSLSASVATLAPLPPGSYTMSYDRGRGRFVITPWSSSEDIINVSLANRPATEVAKYQGYRDSLSGRGVPLRVVAGDTGVAAGGEQSGGETQTQFNVQIMTPEDFRAMAGLSPDALVEGVLVNGSQLPMPSGGTAGESQPGAPAADPSGGATFRIPQAFGLPAALARYPSYPIPPNATGIFWTQFRFGHLSQFANVGGQMNASGFRFSPWRGLFPSQLGRGVPGSYMNDFMFTLLPNQTVVYRASSPEAAAAFAERLGGTRGSTQYELPYRFPPRAGSNTTVCGSNCVNVPVEEIEAALGVRPEILTPEGPVDITQMGRPRPGAPFEPQQVGRGATVREYLNQPDAVFEAQGLTRVNVPNITPMARGGVFFLRVGGRVLLIYGAIQTTRRIYEARNSPQLPVVVAEEAGSWGGGLLGGAIGSAVGAGIVCSPTGPVTLVCVAGGFLGGLLVGAIGAYVGGEVGHSMATSGMQGGGVCPSCHAMQREWARQREWSNFRDPMFDLNRAGFRPGLPGTTIDADQLRALRAWIESAR